MLLLSALWLAVVQALASPYAPAGVGRAVGVSVSAASGAVAAVPAATEGENARPAQGAMARPWSLLHDEEYRPAAPQRLPTVERTSDRCVPPLRSAAGPAQLAAPDLPVSLARAASSACYQESHAAASRGGHLPYYPTAPPLQG